MNRLATLLLLTALPVFGANHYVRPGASGGGTTWADPMAFPATTAVRGDTYYLASGAYGFQIYTPPAGSTYIYFRKATAADHGTDTGWQSSYGTGPATFIGGFQLRGGYTDFDGNTPTSLGVSGGYGFQFSRPTTNVNEFAFGTFPGFSAPGIRLHNAEVFTMTGGGLDAPTSASMCSDFAANSFDGLLIEGCYYHNGGAAWIELGYGNNVTIQKNIFRDLGSGYGAQHCNGIATQGSNVTIRWNDFADAKYNVTDYIEPQSSMNGLYIYGNLFWAKSSTEFTAKGAMSITGTDGPQMFNIGVFNNTLYGLHILTGGGIWGGNTPGANTVWVTNNIVPDVTANFPNTSMGNNINASGVSFVSASAGNFHLSAATPNGTTLPSPYNTDTDGTLRGADGNWDIGAYEYSGVTPPPTATMQFTVSSVTVSESSGTLNISVTRKISAVGAISCNYTTFSGTAQPGVNYTPVSGTLTWADGDSHTNVISVPILDTHSLGNFTFSVNLSNPQGSATLAAPSTCQVTLTGSATVPATPVNISPAPSAVNVSPSTSLTLSAYSSTNPQLGARFLVYLNGGLQVWDSGILGATNSVPIPAGVLAYSTQYTWTGSYSNFVGWSSPSLSTLFTTTNMPPGPPPPLPPPTNSTIVITIINPASVIISNAPAIFK